VKLAASVKASGNEVSVLERLRPLILHLAGLESLQVGPEISRPAAAVVQVVGGMEIFVPGLVDPAKERERLAAKRAKLVEDAQKTATKLANEGFVARAPADVVEKEKQKLREFQSQIEALDAALRELDS